MKTDRREIKRILGGHCKFCEESLAVQIHHLWYEGKEGANKGREVPASKVMANPHRFLLLCRPHHVRLHRGLPLEKRPLR